LFHQFEIYFCLLDKIVLQLLPIGYQPRLSFQEGTRPTRISPLRLQQRIYDSHAITSYRLITHTKAITRLPVNLHFAIGDQDFSQIKRLGLYRIFGSDHRHAYRRLTDYYYRMKRLQLADECLKGRGITLA
jgi:hypothetical protein